MVSKETLKRVLSRALSRGGDFADLFIEKKVSASLRLEDGRLEEAISGYDVGAGLRVISNGSVGYVFTDDLSEDGLLEIASRASVAARLKSGTTSINLTSSFRRSSPLKTQPIEFPPQTVSRQKKAEMVTKADKHARSVSKEIIQVAVSYLDSVQDVVVVNSEGLLAEDKRTLTRLFVHVVARRKGVVQTGLEAPGLHAGFEFFEKYPAEKTAETAANRAVTMLDARPAPAGKMPVIIAQGSGGVLFHEACGHGLEADAVQKGASVYSDRIGEKIASVKVSAADDPTLINRWGSFSFDDEGTPAECNLLIEKGILKNFMYDRLRARRVGVSLTSNGRRQSFRHVPIPRMTNTYILPGEETAEEIIKATEKGLFAKALGGGEVNPATGDFVFGVSEGYLIEKGKLSYPVRGAILVGNGPRILHLIDMVSNDLDFDAGMCGKDGQAVPVATGQPTLRIKELTVGGTQT